MQALIWLEPVRKKIGMGLLSFVLLAAAPGPLERGEILTRLETVEPDAPRGGWAQAVVGPPLPVRWGGRLRTLSSWHEIALQAASAYNAGMVQYTLRNVPPHLDSALRRTAEEQRKSLNEVTLEVLLRSSGLAGEPVKFRELGDIAGTWTEDPRVDEALAEQRRIDPDLWR